MDVGVGFVEESCADVAMRRGSDFPIVTEGSCCCCDGAAEEEGL